VIVDMRQLGVLLLLVVLPVVVAVVEFGVVVLMCVPVGAVLPLSDRSPFVKVGHVIVIVIVSLPLVDVLGLFALSLYSLLLCHRLPPVEDQPAASPANQLRLHAAVYSENHQPACQ
jgi:hypothetical protein